jgi:hypothetical protein
MKTVNGHNVTQCKGCGADIFFSNGTPYYARLVPVMIRVSEFNPEVKDADVLMEVRVSGYVSHFVNCKNANQFSRDKKTEARDNG